MSNDPRVKLLTEIAYAAYRWRNARLAARVGRSTDTGKEQVAADLLEVAVSNGLCLFISPDASSPPVPDDEEWYDIMRRERKERHENWYAQNMALLRESGLPFEERETACLFRIEGRPRVDFYPHTGRWRVVGQPNSKARSGGARAFLRWYEEQRRR